MARPCAPGSKPDRKAVVRILAETAEATGVPVSALAVPTRRDPNPVCRARWSAWSRIWVEHPKATLYGMAQVLGCHHTSLMHALTRSGVYTPRAA